MPPTPPVGRDERVNWRSSWPFLALHFVPLAAILTGVTVRALVLCGVLYVTRMFFITAGYHRYFAHRSYRVGRPMQLLLAVGGTTACQKGPLWWAGHHRSHHRYADTEADLHSPLKGFWWAHVGWFLSDKYSATEFDDIADFARFAELRWLNRFDWVAPLVLAVGSFLVAGWSGLVVGFFGSTVLLWHGTFLVNSLAHVFGRRRYATSDTSRNSLLIALVTMGEGWHNNHHHHQSSARQGFFWWEIDPTWYVLRLLSTIDLVRDLKRPSASVLAAARVREGFFDIGIFEAHWRRASAALSASKATFGTLSSSAANSVGERFVARRSAMEAKLQADRAALEAFVSSSRQAAEHFAKEARRGRRELGNFE